MANYVQEKNIDIGYELWKRGYRINRNTFSEKEFIDRLNRLNETHNYEITFDTLFEAILLVNPDWLIDEAAEEEAYRKENEPLVREYFQTHFAGKTSDEIFDNEELAERWNFYSDWHKEVFGYRPHDIVCGIYVNPYTGERQD